jgi:hypothetical protein
MNTISTQKLTSAAVSLRSSARSVPLHPGSVDAYRSLHG